MKIESHSSIISKYLLIVTGTALLNLLVVNPVEAAPSTSPKTPASPRQAIQQAYNKSTVATGLRFLDGMYALRSRNFSAIAPNGKRVDLRADRAMMGRILENCLSAKESVEIQSFQQKGPSRAECTVHDITEFLMVEPSSKARRNIRLETTSRDVWALAGGRWRQDRSTILHQGSTTKQIDTPGAPAASSTPTPSATPGKSR